MSRLEVRIPDDLMKKLKNRLENLNATGRQRGDIQNFVTVAIRNELANPTQIGNSIFLLIERNQAQEVFEELCYIPFDIATSQDSEPPNRRHPAIESMIKQLSEILGEK